MKEKDTKLTQERLKEVLDYNPKTGIFIWKIAHSTVKAGDIAGYKTNNRYISIRVDRKRYFAHKLAWLFIYGYLPKYIDHINRIRDNNSIRNLREATRNYNRINSKTPINNTSGVKGVYYNKQKGKWHSRIEVRGKQIHLGYYESMLHAAKSRYEAELKYGWTDISSEMSDAQLYVLKHESNL